MAGVRRGALRRQLAVSGAAALVFAIALGGALDGVPTAAAKASSAVGPVTTTKTVTRTVTTANGTSVQDKRTVAFHVTQTLGLRDRQEVDVSWSGAHPTGGIIADENSSAALQEEYPFVLMECRGVDSTKVPAREQVSPKTCWTNATPERFQADYNTAYPPWRLDEYATKAQRKAIVDAPAKRPAACFGAAPEEYWVPFVAANGTTYEGGTGGCAGTAPEAVGDSNQSLPSNETFGVTQLNGKGSAKFDMWTTDTNASLGCSSTVKCTLVAIPIMGISCDPGAEGLPASDQPPADEIDADTALCEQTGHYAAGAIGDGNGHQDPAVSGALWWAASNWRNRISVPLTFAQNSDVCNVVGAGAAVDVYGSELMTQLTEQWAPKFCLSKSLFNFKHVQIGEPEARALLANGSVDAAFTSQPATGAEDPTLNAPTAVSGFAITFDVDNDRQHPVTKLNLDARLLAKLMTESYPALADIKSGDKALANNPLNITDDPEFQALNPGISTTSQVAATLLDLSSESDVMYALTSYINADPEARAWLNGKADPWGMVVNPAYKKIALPVNVWPELDTYEPKDIYQPGLNDCLYNTPVPYLPLIASPVQRLSQISLAMQFAIANSQTVCSQPNQGVSNGEKLVAIGRENPGFRFMLGVTSIADADRYRLNLASLESQTAPTAAAKFTSTAGRTFVAPSDASMKAAAVLAKPDTNAGDWPIDPTRLRTLPAGAHAYPGTMIVYTSVATKGLSKATAADYAKLLTFAASKGQVRGFGNGQLPPGYLPLTKAEGLGTLVNYTTRAAAAVKAQAGALPTLLPSKSDGQNKSQGSSGPQSTDPAGSTASPGSVTPPPSPSTSPKPSTGKSPDVAGPPATSPGTTAAASSTVAGIALPALLVLAVVAGLLGPLATKLWGRWRAS
jgi:ABC-type phosphate transport system substrate-binding protein